MDFDKFGQRFDAEVGERHNALVGGTINPDLTVLGIHFVSDVPQPVLIFAEHLGNPSDGVDVVDLVD